MAELTSDELAANREKMKTIQARIKEKVFERIVAILARYGISSENAQAISEEIYADYQTISRAIHKDAMGM